MKGFLVLLAAFSAFSLARGLQFREMATPLDPPVQLDDVLATDRQALAYCNGTISLLGTSRAYPIIVQSPNYPSNYPTNIWCIYNMVVPAGRQLNVEILAMDMDCPYDYVALTTDNSPNVLTLCPPTVVQPYYYIGPSATGYTFRAVFYSGLYVTYSGFRIIAYLDSTTVPPPPPPPPVTTTTPPPPPPVTTTTTTTTTPKPNVCKCGTWGIRSDRIVNGQTAFPHQFPYQAAIWTNYATNNSPFCGGSLISPNYVLTAAHCVTGRAATSIKIAVNDVTLQAGDGEIFLGVSSILIHPTYNVTFQDNDFALLRLASPAPISDTVNLACLPPDVTQTFEGANLTVSGWGYISSSSKAMSNDLKFAYITGWSNAACKVPYKTLAITDNMICASTPKIDTDACQGDSGGPLVATVNGRVTLVGVTSFGYGCAVAPYPGVYARVARQKSWILANSDAGLCQN